METNEEKIKEVIAEVIKEDSTDKPTEESEELDGYVEFTSASEYINSAYFAMSAVEDIDTAIISKEDEKRIKRIKRKSIKIIDICISEMYDELFETDEDDQIRLDNTVLFFLTSFDLGFLCAHPDISISGFFYLYTDYQ